MKTFSFVPLTLIVIIGFESMMARYLLVEVDGGKPIATVSGLEKAIKELTPEERRLIDDEMDALLPVAREYLNSKGIQSRKEGCFHGSNKVTLENGEKKQMSELENGDSVLAMNKGGSFTFSPVIMQLRQSPDEDATFRIIRTSLGHNLTLTPNHLIYTRDGNENNRLVGEFSSFHAVFASTVKNGDYVLVNDGTNEMKQDKVVEVATISLKGFYAPLTEEGNIVVENILASCYTDFENQQLLHLAFAPFRWFHHAKTWINSKTEEENKGENLFGEAGVQLNLFHWYGQALEMAAKNLVPNRMNW